MTQVGLFSLELALSIGVPALIAFAAPPRWRFWALGLWRHLFAASRRPSRSHALST